MIEACFAELEPLVGTAAACRGSGRSRATHYRRLAPPVLGPPVPRSSPPMRPTQPKLRTVAWINNPTIRTDAQKKS